MPIDQPRRHNPLMLGYVDRAKGRGHSSQYLGKLFGVSHSQMYMARERNVGARNAERITRGMQDLFGLSERERLELKAEIMGDPGNLVLAYVSGRLEDSEGLNLNATAILDVCRRETVGDIVGRRALEALEDAPEFVLEQVRAKIRRRPPGKVTHRQSGLEARNRRAAGISRFTHGKPLTAEALEKSGLSRKELYRRAGIGKETLRNAMQEKTGIKTALVLTDVLGEAAGLSADQREAVVRELTEPPKLF